MKKLAVALSVILVMLVIEVFPCYSQVIIGCVEKKSGQLRIVTSTTPCKPSENRISWNQVGPQGPQGPQGIAGPAGKDGLQGPPGVGNLGVYDGNDLFLGYLVDSEINRYRIFNPNIPGLLTLIFEVPGLLSGEGIGQLFFTTENCTSQPFMVSGYSMHHVLVDTNVTPNIYYIYDSQVPAVRISDLKSSKNLQTGICTAFSYNDPIVAYPVKQIDVPLLNQTFEYPIVVKPIQ